jgi:hypothetical protein
MLVLQKKTGKFLLLILIFNLLNFDSRGQSIEDIKLLDQKIIKADSIFLISHKSTREYGGRVVPDWDISDTSMNLKKWYKLNPPKPKFLINGSINKKIIVESFKLTKQDRLILSNILLRQVNLDTVELLKCDQPAHSIIFYHNQKTSFIDICFGCKKIHTSKDINLDESNVDNKKWAELKKYFKVKGLTKLFTKYDE